MDRLWIIVVAVVVSLTGCSSEQTASTERTASTDSVSRPDSEVSGARIYLYDRGRVTTEVVADKVVNFEALDSTMAYNLDVDIYDSTGAVSAHVVGDSGIIHQESRSMSIYGNVVATTTDSIKLETDRLYWDSEVDSIKTDAFVRLTKGEDVWTGWGLQADQRLHSTRILRQVSGTITDPKRLFEQ